jgi:hypothetical protein
MSMITESFYSNVREIRGDLNLVEELKKVVADHLRGSTDKTEKVFHLYLIVKFHGTYTDPHCCISERFEGGRFIINVEDNYKIMQVLDQWKSTNGSCLHENSKKRLLTGDLEIQVHDYKNLNKINALHYSRSPLP